MTVPAAPKVLVLGAGMSGLVAAYELMTAGYDVTVLEGRDVAGGRVQTIRTPFSSGHYAEAGAMFFPGEHTLTIGYAQHFNVPLEGFAHFASPTLYYLQGHRIIDPPPKGAPANRWPFGITELEQTIGLGGMNEIYTRPGLTAKIDGNQPTDLDRVFDQINYDTRMQGLGSSAAARKLL